MDIARRDMLKAQAAAAAAAVANVAAPAPAQNIAAGEDIQLKWSKAPCRFCGTGCGVMVGVKDGRVVATHGDMQAEVNRGLNCVKGYFLSKIMYGADRLTPPLHAHEERAVRQGRRAPAGLLGPGLRRDGAAVEARAEGERARTAVGMFGSGQWTIFEGYAATKLMRGGFRSNNLDPNARHCMASAAVTFIRTFGMDEPMGCYDDFEHADAFVLWGSNMAEMHPILWTRVTDRRLSAPHVRIHTLSTYEHRTTDLSDASADLQARHRPGDPELHRQPHHPDRRGEPRLRRQARQLPDRQHRHRLRPAARARAGAARPARQRRRRSRSPSDFDAYAQARAPSTRSTGRPSSSGVPKDAAGGAGEALCRPEDQGDVALDHGLQPARPRRLGEPPRLQHPPADRENRRARQQPVLADRPALRLRHGARGRHLLASPARRHAGDQPRAPQARGAALEAPGGPAARQGRLPRRRSRTGC